MKNQMRRLQTAEMHFLRAVAGYRMREHKRNEDIRGELGTTDIRIGKTIKRND
jgi:hypothetical protein